MPRARALGPFATIAAAGLLTGYVGAALVGTILRTSPALGANGEAPVARDFMISYLRGDGGHLAQLRPPNVAVRAIEYEQVTGTAALRAATSLTYLGGGQRGGMTVNLYVAGAMIGEDEQLVPFALTVVGGRVVVVR